MNLIRLPAAALLAATLAAFAAASPAAQMPSREVPWRAEPPATLRAPQLAPALVVALDGAWPKAAAAHEEPSGRLAVGTVRALAKSAAPASWSAVAGGFATRIEARSLGAEGLRARLDVAGIDAPLEVRALGADGRIEFMRVEPGRAPEAWTPWTEGAFQAIEIFSAAPQPVALGALVHFTASPLAKAAGSCTVPTMCGTGNPTLDAAIAQRKRSLLRINFVDGGRAFVCSATLINTPRAPAGYVLTANHCIDNAGAASTITSLWFHELSGCDAASPAAAGSVQVAGGMQLVFNNHNVDSALLLMPATPPAGAVYSGWNAARMAAGTSVTSLSHPSGDAARVATGSVSGELRIVGIPQDMYGVRFSSGIIEGGSSGSGIFTLSSTEGLQLRGVLSGTTVRSGPMSCSNRNEEALYGRFELLHPQIAQYIGTAAAAADDAPNRVADFVSIPLGPNDVALDERGAPLAFDARRIDYAGDLDLYRFTLAAPATVSAWTEGANLDTVGSILDADGANIAANDDAQTADHHFGVTRRLQGGTYYVQVGHFDAAGTGTYNLRIRADATEERNHTALWWNSAEPGWGLNVNHQGDKVFATLFTYDAAGPMWLVMSDGARQSDGTYSGRLFRTTGPAFNAVPFGPVNLTEVGTMRLAFSAAGTASVAYTYNGVAVSKGLQRQEFGSKVPTCTWSHFDRSYARNFQDLWYNPAEPGWGVNVAHQGDKIFATLFTYEANGNGLWLVMSDGALSGSGFTGPLYRTSGPVFNAAPWTAATSTAVGQMTFTPDARNSSRATLAYTYNGMSVVKQVQRQVFATPKPECE